MGGVFIYAGIVKAMDTQGFARAILEYRLLDYKWSLVVASVLPYIEMVSGILMLAGFRTNAAKGILILSMFFVLILSITIIRGIEVDCSCFGNTASLGENLWMAVAKNMVILTGCVWILKSEPMKLNPTPEISSKMDQQTFYFVK